jgi:Uma2 family endonuclease
MTSPAQLTGHTWTVEEYFKLDDDQRYEVLDGELIMVPAPGIFHQRAITRLGTLIDVHVVANDLGECFHTPFDVVLSDLTVVQPDFTFVSKERFNELYDGHGLTGAPDLVIEVVSPSSERRDRTQKRELYRKVGVSWLMLVEPKRRIIEVFRLDLERDAYLLDTSAAGNEPLEFGLFEGLVIDLGSVWLKRNGAEDDDEIAE